MYICETKQGPSQSMRIYKQTCFVWATNKRCLHNQHWHTVQTPETEWWQIPATDHQQRQLLLHPGFPQDHSSRASIKLCMEPQKFCPKLPRSYQVLCICKSCIRVFLKILGSVHGSMSLIWLGYIPGEFSWPLLLNFKVRWYLLPPEH